MTGRVEAIFICPQASAPMQPLDTVRAAAGIGLAGDRYSDGTGFYSDRPRADGGRELTLISTEMLAEVFAASGIRLTPLESRRRMVENHRLNICFENERFLFDPWFLKPGINISYFQVIELLRAETISFEESFIDNSGWRIVFPSGVYIDFDYERHSEFKDDPPIDKAHLVVNAMRMFDWGI